MYYLVYGRKATERSSFGGVSMNILGVGTVLCLERDAWSMVK